MPDKLSGVAGHIAFWPCISNKRCPANINCLYKAFFLILLSPVELLIYWGWTLCPESWQTFTGSTGHVRQNSKKFKCLFILDLEFFQKLMNLSVNSCKKTWTFANVREKRSELISRKMTNDDEWWWNSVKSQIWFTREGFRKYMVIVLQFN